MKTKSALPKGSKSVAVTPGMNALKKASTPSAAPTKKLKSKIPSTTTHNPVVKSEKEQLREVLQMVKAIRSGDFTVRLNLENDSMIGDIAEVLNDINELNLNMVNEFIRVGRIVGKEGKMNERVSIGSVKGAWLTNVDSVNTIISDLVRPITEAARVITSVAKGDLSQKMALEVDGIPLNGEFARIGMTVNTIVDQLNSFASEVTRVAKEVGTEGKLGGQAQVKGVSGTWKDLTDNVNFMASNLTTQVRGIVKVVTAVANGDLNQKFVLEAKGEVAALKDNINQMIGNLKDTTDKNHEQDWLKTNLAKFANMMQGQRSITSVAQMIMSELTPLIGAQQGTFFIMDNDHEEPVLSLFASYAFTERKNFKKSYKLKESLIGQAAFEKKRILLTKAPADYVYVASSLGEVTPVNIIVLPIVFEGKVKAVIELASVHAFTPNYLNFLDQLMTSIGVVLNMIASTMRTEELLQELKKSNAELEDKAKLLEIKNQEVELASHSVEEKAEQLSLISKYKSEFLANMSHELRTPLNSLLILSKMLSENKESNLSKEQIKFSQTIYSSGCDLLALINEILDLSKVEAGKMPIVPRDAKVPEICEYLEHSFHPVASHKNLQFSIESTPEISRAVINTDVTRVQQILKNLLSNAFKFTEKGKVTLKIQQGILKDEKSLIFSVVDTGIGIPKKKQSMIFEAFQQADGTTNRKYGGTGLGLTISRQIARLLGGSIEVVSIPGGGSTFTLNLPLRYTGQEGIIEPEPRPEFKAISLPKDADFKLKKILLIDDDMRNIFATTVILERQGMDVIFAENGKQGIEKLIENPDVDMILMDVMMPEMGGIEATQEIRKMEQFKHLPIITLTAKAMKGDKEKSLEAGATDYITKPVDNDYLLSTMHKWLNTDSNTAET